MANYFESLHEGQKHYGRTILLEDLNEDNIRMSFIRFKNDPANKYIGFTFEGDKKEMF